MLPDFAESVKNDLRDAGLRELARITAAGLLSDVAVRELRRLIDPEEKETLHDQYTMAALTGLLSRDKWTTGGAATAARQYADACMEARQA